MPKRLAYLLFALAALALTPAAQAQTPQAKGAPTVAAPAKVKPASASCDRRCLLRLLTDYTEALTDNDPTHLPLAANMRHTYNGVVSDFGKAEPWGPARRLPFRMVLTDPETGSAIFYGIVTISTRPGRADTPGAAPAATPRWWFYVTRLKVVDRKITEIEEIGYEKPQGGFGADPSTLTLPDRIFDEVLPPAERSTKKELHAAAEAYFDAVGQALDYHKVPWRPDCQRIELGLFTVNGPASSGSCGGEFQTPSVKWTVQNRRYYIYDVERGIVLAVGNFTTPPEYPEEQRLGGVRAVQGAGRHDPPDLRLLPRQRPAALRLGDRAGKLIRHAATLPLWGTTWGHPRPMARPADPESSPHPKSSPRCALQPPSSARSPPPPPRGKN